MDTFLGATALLIAWATLFVVALTCLVWVVKKPA